GRWLRSSHAFKECVIAHWSSGFAPKMNGAKIQYRSFGLIENLNLLHKEGQKRKVKINLTRKYCKTINQDKRVKASLSGSWRTRHGVGSKKTTSLLRE